MQPCSRPAQIVHHFINVSHLRQIIDNTILSTNVDFLIIKDVSSSRFVEIESSRRLFGKIRFRRFDKEREILFITIPTGPHEVLHRSLWREFSNEMYALNLTRHWQELGSMTLRSGTPPGGSSGEGDSSGGPKPQRLNGWPTLIVEAGYSQTMNKLHNDMRCWFSASNHDVKIILLVKMYLPTKEIHIERWQEVIRQPQGPITRSRSALLAQTVPQLVPALQQRIIIRRNDGPPVTYSVLSGALVLDYQLLFLRLPVPPQKNIIISLQSLRDFADDVWAALLFPIGS
ncbi:hypothetical protein QBC37DRAFT_444015 [Rhypophila decipiens]|uniref:Uncharacterized protein n=1 Tax=Rhypophila decipiens TaxID=261697 RepID=A0AAN6XZ74_9PEZI|nr:hypothetical protein QBC37DRAFT_444015 [Rhypophila decipiens]